MLKLLELKYRSSQSIVIWYLIVVAISAIVISSSTSQLSIIYHSSMLYYLIKHGIIVIASVFVMYVILKFKRETLSFLSNISSMLIWLSFTLMLLTIIAGKETAEAKRWISIGGLNLQTSELVKAAFIIYAANLLSEIKSLKDLVNKPSRIFDLLLMALTLMLIAANNLSSALIIGLVLWTMILLSDLPQEEKKVINRLVLIMFIVGTLIVVFSPIDVFRSETWRNRIKNAVSGQEVVYSQPTQAKVAIIKGGLVRFNPGGSEQKNVIPQAFSDYLFAIIIEEYGLVGGVIIMSIYLALLVITLKIINRLKNNLLRLLAAGIALSINIQAFVHILVNVVIIPVTGQPLPFFSLGGTSFLINSTMIGLLLAISEYQPAQKKQTPKAKEPKPEDTTDYQQAIILEV